MVMNNSNKNKTAHKRAVLFDKIAKLVIKGGGISIIIAVIGILVFILAEGLPLLFDAKINESNKITLKNRILLSGVDEYQKIVWVLTSDKTLEFINLEKNKKISSFKLMQIGNSKIYSASLNLQQNSIAVGLDSGKVAFYNLSFNVSFDNSDQRIITPNPRFNEIIKIDNAINPINKLQIATDDNGNKTMLAEINRKYFIVSEKIETSILGDTNKIIVQNPLNQNISKIKFGNFLLDHVGKRLFGIANGNRIYSFQINDDAELELITTKQLNLTSDEKISATCILLGSQSLIVGTTKGNLFSYVITNNNGKYNLTQSHKFDSMTSEIKKIISSKRRKEFLVSDKLNNLNLYFLTSEKLLFNRKIKSAKIEEIRFAPKSDGMLVRLSNDKLINFQIENPHPETSLKTLFGKILYEGYSKPEYSWQSTGGDDSFESKLNLIPLIYGTLKGTFYAMLFAVPLALLGAFYTSTFAHPKIKNKVKPIVELMSALPSVVIGFLAGIWLAPELERNFSGFILLLFIEPLMIIFAVFLWQKFSILNNKVKAGYELLLIIPFLILGSYIALELGPYFESIFWGTDFRSFLESKFQITYDQRNSIVVGFAMGFAVIPIIFTICEDSISTVPESLTSASLALGANKWQTGIRVVLPTASPGIFSAIMIGFGRAIGETMIVLMATGNTPIMSMNPFNGMRTLSANIAVEIPEAPFHGTLYRVLFVSAALLFILTFLINTIAELVRQRLRKKYMHV